MKNLILIFCFGILIQIISSCSDIMTTEPKYDKELISKKLNGSDSLAFLKIKDVDLGSIKVRTTIYKNIVINNISDTHSITIYKVDNVNKSGLFTYNFLQGLPFTIEPTSDTEIVQKLEVKFIADSFIPALYYDTLTFNDNQDFKIPIKIRTRY